MFHNSPYSLVYDVTISGNTINDIVADTPELAVSNAKSQLNIMSNITADILFKIAFNGSVISTANKAVSYDENNSHLAGKLPKYLSVSHPNSTFGLSYEFWWIDEWYAGKDGAPDQALKGLAHAIDYDRVAGESYTHPITNGDVVPIRVYVEQCVSNGNSAAYAEFEDFGVTLTNYQVDEDALDQQIDDDNDKMIDAIANTFASLGIKI